MAPRVSTDDLAFAAEWVRTYDASGEDENGERAVRIVAWLEAEIKRRDTDAAIRRTAKRHGVSRTFVRRALAERRSA